MSELRKFADEVTCVADEFEKIHLLNSSYDAAHRKDQIVTDFLHKTNLVINSVLEKVGRDVASVDPNISTHQWDRHQFEEGETNEGGEELKKRVRHAGEPSGFATHAADGTRDTSDAGDDRDENGFSITRILADQDGHQINARFAKIPTETCIRCCPKEKGGHRRATNQVEDSTLAEGVDDHHRAAWIAPSWVQSCAICCDDGDEPTTCPPVPEPAPCPTPMPTASCPEPTPCPTPPPTMNPPPTPSPTLATCIEPLEDLEDFSPVCGSRLSRTYYRVRTFTIPDDCEVYTDGPLVVESVNTTIQGSLVGTGQGKAGASGCKLSASSSSDNCESSEGAGQGIGGGTSSISTSFSGGGGGGGYGGRGGDTFGAPGGLTYDEILQGSGGGAGKVSRDNTEVTSGSGGNGGGLISILSTDTFILSSAGTIDVDGDDGGDGAIGEAAIDITGGTSGGGGGGGGSGGGVEITACTAMIEGNITASGGNGGNGAGSGGTGGGGGGGGRIRIATEAPSDITGLLLVNGGAGGSGGGGGGAGDPGVSEELPLS